jgi:hypothetical protein
MLCTALDCQLGFDPFADAAGYAGMYKKAGASGGTTQAAGVALHVRAVPVPGLQVFRVGCWGRGIGEEGVDVASRGPGYWPKASAGLNQ